MYDGFALVTKVLDFYLHYSSDTVVVHSDDPASTPIIYRNMSCLSRKRVARKRRRQRRRSDDGKRDFRDA